jgi:hypothetical protein
VSALLFFEHELNELNEFKITFNAALGMPIATPSPMFTTSLFYHSHHTNVDDYAKQKPITDEDVAISGEQLIQVINNYNRRMALPTPCNLRAPTRKKTSEEILREVKKEEQRMRIIRMVEPHDPEAYQRARERYHALLEEADAILDQEIKEAETQVNNNIQNKRNYEEDLSSSGSSSHKHCISINRIYDLLHRCGLWRSGHHVP